MAENVKETGFDKASEAMTRLKIVSDSVIQLCREHDIEMVGISLLTLDRGNKNKATVSISRLPVIDQNKISAEQVAEFYDRNIQILVNSMIDNFYTQAELALQKGAAPDVTENFGFSTIIGEA